MTFAVDPASADQTMTPPQAAELDELARRSQGLAWTEAQAGQVGRCLAELTTGFYASRRGASAFRDRAEARLVVAPRFAEPKGTEASLRLLLSRLMQDGIDPTSPGFMGYIPGGGLPDAAVGQYLAAVTNRYVGMTGAAPEASAVEDEVISWLCNTFALPGTAWGTLTSGASIATVTALMTARDQGAVAAPRHQLVAYLSREVHLANEKALHVVGIERRQLRLVATDPTGRMDLSALLTQITADRVQGLTPWLVVGTAGTTNTGAIDPLADLAALATKERLWLHIDAAYGGFFRLVPEFRGKLAALALADSLVVDPHKSLFLPYGTGAVLVANGALLRASASGREGDYLADLAATRGGSACDYSLELTRPSRGAGLWQALTAHGEGAFAAALQEKRALALWLDKVLRGSDLFAMGPVPDLTVVSFRSPHGDEATARWLTQLTADGRFLLSSTRLGDRLYLRSCVLCYQTHRQQVVELASMLKALASGDLP